MAKKSKIKDVTKAGHLSYRQLQEANLEAYTRASLVSKFANLAKPQYLSSRDFIYEGSEQSPIYQLSGGEDYWGNSHWDASTPNVEDWNRLSDVRAENQGPFIQVINGIAKGAVLAGTTFINGTVGLLTGISQAVENATSDDPNKHWYEGIWDNPVSQAMHEVNLLAEEYMPNYRTQAQQEAPWYSWDNLSSANFIFDTVVKNMGFMVGAMYSGGIYTKAIDWAFKAFKLANFGRATAATIEAGKKAVEASRATRATKGLIGSFFGALAEAVQEAYNSKLNFITVENQRLESLKFEQLNEAILEFALNGGIVNSDGTPDVINSDPNAVAALNKRMADIETATSNAKSEVAKLSENVGTMTGLLNMAILWPSNILMFGKMYAGGWKAARTEHKNVIRSTKEALKEAKAAAKAGDPSKMNKIKELVARAESTGFQGLTLSEKAMVELVKPKSITDFLGAKLGYTKAATKGMFREFNEEMLQGAAEQASTYKYENDVDAIFNASLDPNATYETRSTIDSILKGIVSQYGDLNKWEEGVVGAITGFLGAPTFGRKTNSTDQTVIGRGKWIGLTGGMFSDIRNYRNQRRTSLEASLKATEALRNEDLAGNIKHLIALTRFTNDMNRATIHDDEKEYKDARTAATFEMINHLRRVGRLDLLQRAMEATTEFTDEDIAEIANMVTKSESATIDNIQLKTERKKFLESAIFNMLEDLRRATEDGREDDLEEFVELIDRYKTELDNLDAELSRARPVTLSPYMHEDGTPFTNEEIKADIQKRVNNFDKIIQTITTAQEEIDEATSGRLTNELLDTLTWYRVMMLDWAERSQGITDLWKEVINRLASDPALKEAIKSITEVDNLLKEAGLDLNKAKIQYGGRFANLSNLKNYADVLDLLLWAASRGGLELAYLLSSPQKLESGLTVGEYLNKQFENILKGDTSMTKDTRDIFLKNLKDLTSMGESHLKYNQLLEEYLKTPEKIDKAHRASTNKAQSITNKRNLTSTINGIDWNAPTGHIAKYLRDNLALINEAGGFEEFIKNLTPELKKKAREAQKLIMSMDSLDTKIEEAELEDVHAQLLRLLMEEHIDDADNLEELANSISEDIDNGKIDELLRSSAPLEDEELMLRQVEAAELAIREFMDEELENLAKITDEAERAIEAERNRMKEEADNLKDDTEPDPEEAPEEEETNYEEPSETPAEEPSEEEKETPVANPTTATDIKSVNKQNTASPIAGQPGFNRRRWLSQFFLQGVDKQTLPEFYEEHPEHIPKGVDPDLFLKYIRATHKFLVDSGAYAYISGVNPEYSLKEGDTIYFTTNDQLNEDAGTTVILMAVKDKDGKQLIIGSLPTSLDFQSVLRGSTKTLAEVNPEDKALYDTLCDELTSGISFSIKQAITTILQLAEEAYSKIPDSLKNIIGMTASIPLIQTKIRRLQELLSKDTNVIDDIPIIDSLLDDIFGALNTLIAASNNGRNSNIAEEAVKLLARLIAIKTEKLLNGYASRRLVEIQEKEKERGGTAEINHSTDNPRDIYINGRYLWLYSNRPLDLKGTVIGIRKGESTELMDVVRYDSDRKVLIARDRSALKTEHEISDFENIEVFQNIQLNQPKTSQITTKVEALRSGRPSFSALNRSVSEVFGDQEIPITVILNNGTRSSESVKNPLLSNSQPGLVYVFVDSNTGALIPLLCFSTNLKDLSNNDWYVELTISVIQKLADEVNIGSVKSELLRWLPFLTNLHINVTTNENTGLKYVLFGWGRNREGKVANTYSIKLQPDNTISRSNAQAFFHKIARLKITLPSGSTRYPTTNVDRNRLGDKEYMSNISRYIKVNVTPDSSRTIDDWFSYEATPLQKKGKKPSTTNPAVPSTGKKGTTEEVLTPEGEGTISAAGTVEGDDAELTPEQKEDIIKKSEPEVPATPESPSADDNSIANMFGGSAIGTGGTPSTHKRRRRRPKTLLVTDTNDEAATQELTLKDIDKVGQLFPSFSKELKVVLVNGLIKIIDENGNSVEAYGLFKNGVIYLSNQSPVGTAFHEAFHYVADTLLSDSDKQTMFDEATKVYGNLDLMELEEKLAEDFREFMNERQDHSVKGRLKNIFLKLKHIVKSLLGKEAYLDSLFWNIYRGKIAEKSRDNIVNGDTKETSYTPEMLDIKDKTIADGTFMKAPNGNPTNLTERQWLQVRTKNFINWFGDWINNPAEASKVVDENGEPLVVYHGTRTADNIKKTGFSKKMSGKGNRGANNLQFYFTSSPENAEYTGINSKEINPLIDVLSSVYDLFKTTEIPSTDSIYKNINDNKLKVIELKKELNNVKDDSFIKKIINKLFKLFNINIKNSNDIKKEYIKVINSIDKDIEELYRRAKIVHYLDTGLSYLAGNKKTQVNQLHFIKEFVNPSSPYRQIAANRIINILYGTENLVYSPAVLPVFLNIRTPLSTDFNMKASDENPLFSGHYSQLFIDYNKKESEILETLKDSKYDGRIGKNMFDILFSDIYIAKDPNQIKSATDNTGEFSTTNDNIYDSYKQDLLEHRAKKLAYDNLDQATKEYLEARKISQEEYENLNVELKEILLLCM